MSTIDDFDQALNRVEARQQTARRRAWLTALLPVTLGVAFLAYATWQLQDASRAVAGLRAEAQDHEAKVAALSAEIDERTRTIEQLQGELKTLETSLQETTEITRHVHPIDMVDMKMIFSTVPSNVANVLGTVLEQRERDVGWRLGGTAPEQGFDSPSFAAFVLERHRALPPAAAGGADLLSRSRRLFRDLPTATTPQPGDLVFYPSGYALFYFIDQRREPFVVGMTPSGIVALDPDFAEPVGVRRPAYR
jgi:cell wall-associated NlpC family hydrolase